VLKTVLHKTSELNTLNVASDEKFTPVGSAAVSATACRLGRDQWLNKAGPVRLISDQNSTMRN